MKKSQHTKDWFIGDGNYKAQYKESIEDGTFHLFDICNDGHLKEVEQANVKLAIAAPDLADALNESVDAMKAIRIFVIENMQKLPDSEQVRLKTLIAMNNAEQALTKAGYKP